MVDFDLCSVDNQDQVHYDKSHTSLPIPKQISILYLKYLYYLSAFQNLLE